MKDNRIIYYTYIFSKNPLMKAVVRRSLWCSFCQNHDNTKGVPYVPEQIVRNTVCEGMCRTPTHYPFPLNAVVRRGLWRSIPLK